MEANQYISENKNVESYLSQIEIFLTTTQIKDNQAITNLFTTTLLINNEEKELFYLTILKQLKTKSIYFIRHAQAKHNTFKGWCEQRILCRTNPDPQLTTEGVEQCKRLKEKLDKLQVGIIETVFISPLSRTIKTFSYIKDSAVFANTSQYYITDLIREKLKNHNQVGLPLNKLKDTYKDLDYLNYDYMLKEQWWNYNYNSSLLDTNKDKEEMNNLDSRLVLFFIWLSLIKENVICVVSHSYIFKWLYNHTRKAKNTDFVLIEYNIIWDKISVYLETLPLA